MQGRIEPKAIFRAAPSLVDLKNDFNICVASLTPENISTFYNKYRLEMGNIEKLLPKDRSNESENDKILFKVVQKIFAEIEKKQDITQQIKGMFLFAQFLHDFLELSGNNESAVKSFYEKYKENIDSFKEHPLFDIEMKQRMNLLQFSLKQIEEQMQETTEKTIEEQMQETTEKTWFEKFLKLLSEIVESFKEKLGLNENSKTHRERIESEAKGGTAHTRQ